MPSVIETIDEVVTVISNDSVQADSLSSLPILEAVEKVSNYLCAQINKDRKMVRSGKRIIQDIESEQLCVAYDTDEHPIIELIESAEESVKERINQFEMMRQSAKDDPKLIGYKRDNVVSYFTEAIETASILCGVAQTMRWAVLEHDANLDTTEDKVFESAEGLITELNS